MALDSPAEDDLPDLLRSMTQVAPTGLFLTPSAFQVLQQEATASLDGLETGGILLGTEERGTLMVRHAGGPGPAAQREPAFFLRDLRHARSLADQLWQEDGSQWVGEWHTHLTGNLAPSLTDLRSYIQHLHDPELGFARFAAIIAGIDHHERISIAAWLVDRHVAMPVPLVVWDGVGAPAHLPVDSHQVITAPGSIPTKGEHP